MNNRGAACLLVAAGFTWLLYTGALDARQQAPRVEFTTKQSSAIRYLKVSNPGEDDRIGIGDPLVGVTLAMSADGNTLAVSTPHEDGAATGVNGNQQDESAWDSGAAYVFARNGNTRRGNRSADKWLGQGAPQSVSLFGWHTSGSAQMGRRRVWRAASTGRPEGDGENVEA